MKKIWHRLKIFSPFVEGFAHAFDMFGVLNRKSDNLAYDRYAKDLELLERDWQLIGEDFRKIIFGADKEAKKMKK